LPAQVALLLLLFKVARYPVHGANPVFAAADRSPGSFPFQDASFLEL
jgi:hypothetical protein